MPLCSPVWLNDLITMAAPFGFNERLVRTSMFRLVAERWVANERVGRRSQYSLTAFGLDEFSKADARIYRTDEPDWDGAWTIVFVVPGLEQDQEFVRRLRWRGFAELSRAVYAAPTNDVAGIRLLSEELGVAPPLVASATFQDITPLAGMAPFQATSGIVEAGAAYAEFVDNYRWTTELDATRLSARDCFVLRTMIVHDLRRARLRDPELPRDLLPPRWNGDAARQLAATVYRATEDGTWQFAESVTGLRVDRTQDLLTRRFAEHPTNPIPTR